jgi:hypothetical protein
VKNLSVGRSSPRETPSSRKRDEVIGSALDSFKPFSAEAPAEAVYRGYQGETAKEQQAFRCYSATTVVENRGFLRLRPGLPLYFFGINSENSKAPASRPQKRDRVHKKVAAQ